MAMISAWAVGSFEPVTKLTPEATTSSSLTTNAPNGPPRPPRTFSAAKSIAFFIQLSGVAVKTLLRPQILVEPGERASHTIQAVFLIVKSVSFARIHHQLCRHLQRFQRVPKLKRLRRRTFSVAFTH